jgi:hypothetical protein
MHTSGGAGTLQLLPGHKAGASTQNLFLCILLAGLERFSSYPAIKAGASTQNLFSHTRAGLEPILCVKRAQRMGHQPQWGQPTACCFLPQPDDGALHGAIVERKQEGIAPGGEAGGLPVELEAGISFHQAVAGEVRIEGKPLLAGDA